MQQTLPESPEMAAASLTEDSILLENPRPPGKTNLTPRFRAPGPGRFPGVWKPLRSLFWLVHVAFGTVCLVLILAILAAIPLVNLITLGCLLDAQKRVATTGRLRDGFPLMKFAPRLGVICFFSLLFLIPVRILATQANAALIVRGGTGISSDGLIMTLRIVQLLVAAHLIVAIGCGGSPACFLRPVRNLKWLSRQLRTGEYLPQLDLWAGEAVATLRPMYHFVLGLKAVVGAFCWLVIPTGLLVAYSAPGRVAPFFGLMSFLGGVVMIPVAAWLPLLQVHQTVTGRFSGIFQVSAACRVIRQAPLTWMVTTILMYVMTLPLYLAKVRLLPADAFLVLTPIFVLLIYPARVLVAWAYHRGMRFDQPAWFGLRWGTRLLMIPLLAIYAGFLFLTPTISELGKAAPLENHAFLSPVPYAQWGSTKQ